MNTTKNYHELIRYIENVCIQHPYVNSFFYGIYQAHETPDICYGAIILTPGEVVTTRNTTDFSFNIMYIDRLTNDRANITQVQSEAIDAIRVILSVIAEDSKVIDYEQSVTLNVFTDQFADNVAGAVGRIEFSLPSNIGECAWYDNCEKC